MCRFIRRTRTRIGEPYFTSRLVRSVMPGPRRGVDLLASAGECALRPCPAPECIDEPRMPSLVLSSSTPECLASPTTTGNPGRTPLADVYRSRKALLPYATTGAITYSMNRRRPVRMSTAACMPGRNGTTAPSISIAGRRREMRAR